MFFPDLTENQIMALASNKSSYSKGLAYYSSRRVHNFQYLQENFRIDAQVSGTWRYNVRISLEKDGTIGSFRCNCPAFGEYPGACKHIIAVLKTAQKKLLEFRENSTYKKQIAQDLLSFFASQNENLPKEELNLELSLYIYPSGYKVSAHVELKLGLQRLYIVKDFGAFLTCFLEEKEMEFGKQFIYDPQKHTFKAEDSLIIVMLKEMYEQHSSLKELQSYSNNSSIFSEKYLPLTSYYLKRLLDALGTKTFKLTLGSQPERPTQINRSDLPLEFSLEARDLDIALVMDSKELPIQLTSDGSYYFYKREIYLASEEQRKALPSILKAFQKGLSSEILLPAIKKESFVSEALPYIRKVGKVSIKPELAEKFIEEVLQTKIYFDKAEDNGISARIEFHYGEIIINPFTANRDNNIDILDQKEAILVRSTEKERQVLNIFEFANFTVFQGSVHLTDEEKIFDFTLMGLPQLQEYAEIYYSNQFHLKLHSSSSFSGRARLDENLNLLEISFQYGDIEQIELSNIFHSLHLKKKYHRLRDGSFLDLTQPELNSVASLLENLDLNPDDIGKEGFYLPKFRAMYIDSYLRQANLTGIQRNKAFKQLVQSILEPQDGEYEIPDTLKDILRDYQKTGFKWLKTLASFGLGGILADDMGLGKTLQVLAFIKSESSTNSLPSLVIAPTSLIFNWKEEAKKFVPDLNVLVVEGTPQEREILLGNLNYDLIVTSYPLLRRDIEHYTSLQFSYCFLDEAQHIKNHQTQNAKSVQQIAAKSYFALTGTPIENSLTELWSIFNVLMPGYLLSYKEFRTKYEIPITKGIDHNSLKELSRHVSPFILRRLKKDVLKELPEKIETVLISQLTESQKKIYLAFLQNVRGELAQEIATIGFEKSRLKILAALTRLRQICSHPAMFIEDYSEGSGKMDLFKEILSDALASGHRVLIFSQFTSMLNIIETYLVSEQIKYFYLNGSTKASERLQMTQFFNEGTGEVFLISLKAGGTGLNLTGADMVIHFDPWWNPAVEDQATDRAYRIGQKNVVQVIKLITQGTVEEKVSKLQEKKKELINSVIQPGETLITKLSEQELRDLFELT